MQLQLQSYWLWNRLNYYDRTSIVNKENDIVGARWEGQLEINKDLYEKLTEYQKTELNTALESLKESYGKKDIEKIENDINDLNTKFQTISQLLYEQTTTE